MSTTNKINEKLESITSSVKKYVTELTNLCESEIEKLFLINLLHYLFDSTYKIKTGFEDSGFFTDKTSHNLYFEGFKPIYCEIDEYSPATRLKGIKFFDEVTILSSTAYRSGIYKNEYSIYPQYCVEIESTNYRIDFAIICKLYKDGVLSNEVKIAIECDGFEFHSNKEDLKRDTSRNRAFTRSGWKPYRFSGSEIYSLTNKEIDKLFYEIRSLANGIL